MKRHNIFLTLTLILYALNCSAGYKKLADTIYVICYKDNLAYKFYNVNQNKNQLRIQYEFDVDWELYGHKQSSFFLFYEGPEKLVRNEWSVPTIKTENIKLYKNLYTLEQFTKELNTQHFRVKIANRKIQIMMLYGDKCSTKFEIYPVKVGTTLTDEG